MPINLFPHIHPKVTEEWVRAVMLSIFYALKDVINYRLAQLFSIFGGMLKYISEDDIGFRPAAHNLILSDDVPYPRSAIWSVIICVRSGFFNPCSCSLNLSTLLDQFMLQNFGPHMLQNAASL